MELTLECKSRPEGSKPNALRRNGWIPAVLYGHDGTNSVSIVVDEKSVQKLLKDPSASSSLIELNIPEISWSGKTLLREIQMHPWKGFPFHLSFFSIASQDSVQVDLPLHFVGEPIGVKQGGLFDTQVTQLTLKCPPNKIPDSLDIDVSQLRMGQSLHLSDIQLPEEVEAVMEADVLIASVSAPRGMKAEDLEAAVGEAEA
ncbi:MAG: 50S ribosomal protein L25/general stress protein Ctc [Cyanobacteria bacterium SID2]|nr:50S ribosomal protein L25/general stress protein Ctc [Cyanobacteria bacterium SID2]MBP0004514.1 50S ribosomal protein L25/general stress protein Ctc [Cyanobacteria bacterium SBC]